MEYNDLKEEYKNIKQLLAVVKDADNKTELANNMRKAITVDQVAQFERFIEECNDMGMGEVVKREAN